MRHMIVLFLLAIGTTVYSQQIVGVRINQAGIEKCFATSAKVPELDHFLKVYPNPVSTSLNVDIGMPGVTGQMYFKLISASGQVVYSESRTGQNERVQLQIPTAGMSPGLYILRIEGPAYHATEKIFVNHPK